MSFNFPASPSIGQVFPATGTPLYVWNGYLWQLLGGSGGTSTVNISDTPPSPPTDNSLWWESDSGQLLIRYNDGDSTQWVSAVPLSDALQFAVRYDAPQGLTTAQQLQARQNINATAPFEALAYDNIVINGGMEVSQQFGATATSVPNSAWMYTVDQWQVLANQIANTGTFAFVQSASVPTTVRGFRNSLMIYCGTAYTLGGATDLIALDYAIEGTRWAKLGYGGSGALPITISFWVLATVAGTMSVGVKVSNTRSYVTPVTVTAGTWQYKQVTIPGDVAGTWPIDTSKIDVIFAFGCSTTYAATANNTWLGGNYYAVVGGGTNFYAGTNNQVYLTGVSIVPGSIGPTADQSPLMMRPYADELLSCMRYYQVWVGTLTSGYNGAGGPAYSSNPISPPMRTTPTVSFTGLTYGNASALAVNAVNNTNLRLNVTVTAAGNGWGNANVFLNARL